MKGGHALIVEWHFATYKNIEHHTETPYVDLRTSIHFRIEEFWSCEIEGATKCCEVLDRVVQIGETKVNYLDVSGLRNENVLDLKVYKTLR